MSAEKKLLLLNVAGVCHGPREYALSEIHERVAAHVSETVDTQVLFIPSADVRHDATSQKLSGIQLPPSKQLSRLHEALQEADPSRIPVALAHSSGSLAAFEALRDGSLPQAVFVSPTLLDPRREIFCSDRFSQRVQTMKQADGTFYGKMSPASMSYSTVFPSDHLDDELYWETPTSRPDDMEETQELLAAKARLFVGGKDWNSFSAWYPQLFSTTTVMPEENHSFEKDIDSAQKVASAIIDLVKL